MFLVAVEVVGVEADGLGWHWCSKRQCGMILIYRAMDRLIARLCRNNAFSNHDIKILRPLFSKRKNFNSKHLIP
jgi:hypothetical protein